MALAPADFYAYSRATGQPYPESPEERAQQAPEVLEFRRNQLKSQESSNSNPIALGLGIGLGLAGLGGAGFAARRMLQSGKAKGQSGSYQADLSNYDAAQIREAGRYKPASVAPSKVAMDAPVAPVQRTVDIQTAVDDEVTRLLNDTGLLKFVEAEEAAEILKQPEMRAEQSRQRAQVRRALEFTGEDLLSEIRSEPVNTLVTQQQATDGLNVRQAIAALESGEDQQTGRVKNELQRIEGLDLGQIEIPEDIAEERRIITGNPWETEELLEEMGNANRRYQENIYEKGGRTAADLTGTLPLRSAEDARKLRALGVNVRGNQVRLAEFSDSAGREGIGINRLSPQEILDRTMASVSYPREMRDQFLNPNIKTEDLRKYLGEDPQERAGRVSANPTFEIAGGAAASMPGSPTYSKQTRGAGGEGLTNLVDTTDWQQLRQIEQLNEENLVRDPNTGNFVQMVDDTNIDPTEVMTGGKYGGAEYGDTEGVGNLLIETEAFKEKTNQGTTMIPGATKTMRGAASGSEREERFQDVVLPLRRDADNRSDKRYYCRTKL
jgi:hypothetical protein